MDVQKVQLQNPTPRTGDALSEDDLGRLALLFRKFHIREEPMVGLLETACAVVCIEVQGMNMDRISAKGLVSLPSRCAEVRKLMTGQEVQSDQP